MPQMYDLSVGQNSAGEILISQELDGYNEVSVVITREQIPVLIQWIQEELEAGE